MFVSLHLSPQSRSEAEDVERVEEVVQQAVLADAAGVAAVSLTEHHLAGFNTYCDPLVLGAHLAGRLRQAYIAVHVVQLPLQHPVRVAEQCNMLDLLTRGRCMIAVAPGSVRQIELDTFGVSVEQRSEMTRQRLDAMLRAWGWTEGGDPVDVSTDYDQGVIAARLSPSSFRKPHPLIGRATSTPETIVATGRMGLPVILGPKFDRQTIALYREALTEAGHDADTIADCEDWLSTFSLVSLAPTEAQAERRLDQYIEGGGAGPIVTAVDEGSKEWVAEWRTRQAHRRQISTPMTPDMLLERLRSLTAETGVTHHRIALAEVPGRRAENLESFQLFLEEVLPQLDPEPLRDPARTVLSAAAV